MERKGQQSTTMQIRKAGSGEPGLCLDRPFAAEESVGYNTRFA